MVYFPQCEVRRKLVLVSPRIWLDSTGEWLGARRWESNPIRFKLNHAGHCRKASNAILLAFLVKENNFVIKGVYLCAA